MHVRLPPHHDRWLPWAPVGVASLPILVAAVRAAATGWVPIGDDAYFTVRSRDVLTDDHPLLGAWSSGSVDLDEPVNNLGPLQFDLLAPFTKVSAMAGTAVGVAAVQIAAIVCIAWLVSRLAGARAVLPAMMAVAVLTFTMGSELLITPRQHQFLVLPFLCLLVACWAAAAGDRWALVPAVVAGSLVAQTHLSYPILVFALGLVAIAGQVVHRRAGATRRPWYVATGVGVVLWLQTAIDQLAGWGNFGAVLFSPGESDPPGLVTGTRIVAAVLTSPRRAMRPGWRTFDPNGALPGPLSVVVLLLVLAVSAIGVVWAYRAGRRRTWTGLSVLLGAVLAGVVDAALLPQTVFGLVAANYRWLWAIAAFALLGAATLAERAVPAERQRWFVGAAAVVLSVAVVANLPRSVQYDGIEVYHTRQRVVTEMVAQLRDVDVPSPVVVDESQLYFGHPFTYPTLVVLQEQGVDFRFDNPVQERRFGSGRLSDGTEQFRLTLWHGEQANALRGADDVVVFVDGDNLVAMTLVAG
ncbi:MAG: hypothetical protein QNJ12_00940 [Ilumatobacter sp.]|uniref:hypothetical protein n=1 Tax=Ilumatobacter sp. TaxID=1967498 RepID=UPI002634EDFA|nr:hypothetical protein [Ilumatobacter sp.]MDJ0767318.1 hypothetical protein [Ilumatobacter sp.]